MKTLKFLSLAFCIALGPMVLEAQYSNGRFQVYNAEVDFDYLPYCAKPANSPKHDVTGFTPVQFSSRPVMVRMPYYSVDDSKIYRITKSGSYEYTFRCDRPQKVKEGFKPITIRTFFLETSRKGIIPPEVSYREFVKMHVEDQQSLINTYASIKKENYEFEEASLIYQTSPDGIEIIVANEKIQLELSFGANPNEGEGKMIGVKFLPYLQATPPLVKLLIDPKNNYQLTQHAFYRNFNSVYEDLSIKMTQH